MKKTFDLISQKSFKRILNKQRFFLVFSSLFSFGIFFTLLFKLCSDLSSHFPLPIIAIGVFFLAFSVICAASVILCYLLKKEEEGLSIKLLQAIRDCWKSLWLSLLISMPFLLTMIGILIVIMLSNLLSTVPVVGLLFNTLLIFVPYIASIALMVLFIGSFVTLFFCGPILAQANITEYTKLLKCFKGNILEQVIGASIALFPLVCSVWLAKNSFALMKVLFSPYLIESWLGLVQTLILVAPIALVLTPALSFFFNFSFDFHYSKEGKEEDLVKA